MAVGDVVQSGTARLGVRFSGCIIKHARNKTLNLKHLVLPKRERRSWISMGGNCITHIQIASYQFIKAPPFPSRGEYLVVTLPPGRTKRCAELVVQRTQPLANLVLLNLRGSEKRLQSSESREEREVIECAFLEILLFAQVS